MLRNVTIIAVGALLGFLSGVFGVGGSSVATPILRLLNVPRLLALGTPLPVTLPTALIGGWTYWRHGQVNGRAALWTAAGGAPAVIVGSLLTTRVPGRLLMALTGAFVLAVAVRLLWKPVAGNTESEAAGKTKDTGKTNAVGTANDSVEPAGNADAAKAKSSASSSRINASATKFLALGAGIGFLSGLLANGGGFLLVPAYLLLFAMTAQEAAATSLVAVALLALPGAWVHWRLGHVDARLALLLSVGVVPATFAGAQVGMKLDARRARLAFGVFLLVFGLFFLLRTLYRAEVYGWLT